MKLGFAGGSSLPNSQKHAEIRPVCAMIKVMTRLDQTGAEAYYD